MNKKMIVAGSAMMLALVIAISITAAHTDDKQDAVTASNSSASDSLNESITAGVAGTFQSIELLTAEELDAMVTIEAGETERVAAMMTDAIVETATGSSEAEADTAEGTDAAAENTDTDAANAENAGANGDTDTAENSGAAQVDTTTSENSGAATAGNDGTAADAATDNAGIAAGKDTAENTDAAQAETTTDNTDTATQPGESKDDAFSEEPVAYMQETVNERPQALTAEESEWANYLMADVKNALNVRESASEDADIVGKLSKGDRATIIERGETWTKISSGNLEGYVKNDMCVFGTDALNYAKATCETVAVSTIDGLRVRKEASLDGSVAKKLDKGEKITVDTSAEAVDGWVAVSYNGATCYVSADYVEVSLKTGKGMTLEEIAAAEAAKKAAKSSSGSSKKACKLASEVDDVTLLAAIIECEANGQSYDALLAVGAVIMNRVDSSHYPDTIYDVIHQKGQFPPATSGKLERWLKKGPGKKAIKAAKAAMAGDDNTGGLTNFNSVYSGISGLVIGDNVFYD